MEQDTISQMQFLKDKEHPLHFLANCISEKLHEKFLEKLTKYNRENEEDLFEICHELIDGKLNPTPELADFARLADLAQRFAIELDYFADKYPEVKQL